MSAKQNVRRGECLGNKHHDGRAYIGDKCFAANENYTPFGMKKAALADGYSRVLMYSLLSRYLTPARSIFCFILLHFLTLPSFTPPAFAVVLRYA